MTASKRHTPPDQQAVDDDLDGPSSAVRPHPPQFAVPWLAMTVERLRFWGLKAEPDR